MGGNRVDGLREQRSRMGMWKARVELRTRSRKKRYCRMRGCACRRAALVSSCDGALDGVVVEVKVEVEGGGSESFSMRAQVR